MHQFVTGARRSSDATYGITIKSAEPIVTYLGRTDPTTRGTFGTLGTPLGITGNVV